MGQESEGHTKDVDIFRFEQTALRIHIIGSSAESAPDHLLAEQLAGECPQSHDVRYVLCVPTFREHPDRNHILNATSLFSTLANCVHLQAKQLGLFLFGQLTLWAIFLTRKVRSVAQLGYRLSGSFGGFKNLRVDVQRPGRVTQLINTDSMFIERVLDSRRCLRPVGNSDHHRRCVSATGFPARGGFSPIIAKQVISIDHKIRQRLIWQGLSVQVILHRAVIVDVIQSRPVALRIGKRIVPDHDARRFHQS